jgi:hypothetical protein
MLCQEVARASRLASLSRPSAEPPSRAGPPSISHRLLSCHRSGAGVGALSTPWFWFS